MIYPRKNILTNALLSLCLILLSVQSFGMSYRTPTHQRSMPTLVLQAVTPPILLSHITFNGMGSFQPEDSPVKLAQNPAHGGNGAANMQEDLSFVQKAWNFYQQRLLREKILIAIVVYLLISILALFVAILINRQLQTKKRKKTRELKNEYQEQLAAFLFDDTVERIEFTGINIPQNRQIFIDELRVLHSNLYGETAEKLRDLYFNLELHKDSLRKVYHRSWHQMAKGFREVAQMDVKDANDHIRSFVNAKNPIIRVEAQVAMVKLSEDNPLSFLDELTYELSEWEQINIYDTLTYHQMNIDSFESWLDNPNPSVVQFALRMIGLFKHMHSAPRVQQLLTHKDARIRLAAVQALKPLEVAEYIPDLKELFRRETHDLMVILNEQREENKRDIRSLDDLLPRKIRFAIVECMEPIASAQEIPFLSEVASEHENSFKIRILAIRIMAALHPEGDAELERLLAQADQILSTMIINVKQNLES